MNEDFPTEKAGDTASDTPACAANCACRSGAGPAERGLLNPTFVLDALRRPPRIWIRGIATGLLAGILTAVVMIALKKNGLSPVPAPLGLAFANALMHRHVPLPVGIGFHLAYVTFWGTAFVLVAWPRFTWRRVVVLSAALYLFALLVFVPLVGWGIFGSAVGPRVAGGLAVTHALFAAFLWLSCRLVFPRRRGGGGTSV